MKRRSFFCSLVASVLVLCGLGSAPGIVVVRDCVLRNQVVPGPGHVYVNCQFVKSSIQGIPDYVVGCVFTGHHPSMEYAVRTA